MRARCYASHPSRGTWLPRIPLGVSAQSLAVAGSAVWALGSGPNDEFLTLERINPTFGTVSRVPPTARPS